MIKIKRCPTLWSKCHQLLNNWSALCERVNIRWLLRTDAFFLGTLSVRSRRKDEQDEFNSIQITLFVPEGKLKHCVNSWNKDLSCLLLWCSSTLLCVHHMSEQLASGSLTTHPLGRHATSTSLSSAACRLTALLIALVWCEAAVTCQNGRMEAKELEGVRLMKFYS